MVKSFYIKGNFIMRIMACFQKKCKGPFCEKKMKLRKYSLDFFGFIFPNPRARISSIYGVILVPKSFM